MYKQINYGPHQDFKFMVDKLVYSQGLSVESATKIAGKIASRGR